MKASFSVGVDGPREMIRMAMAGFFEAADIDAMVHGYRAALVQLGSAPNRHVTLVDILGMDIQSQDSVARFRQVLTNPVTVGRRIAFVVGKSLARSQIKRAAEGRDAGFFLTVDEAERWLAEAEGPPARPDSLTA